MYYASTTFTFDLLIFLHPSDLIRVVNGAAHAKAA
jgi:hypothetical protein